MFGAGGAGDAGAAAIKKAATAVSSVSGEQILKAIVDAAGKEGEQNGAAPGAAKNPIAAAIGNGAAGAGFVDNDIKKKDKVAAALVLRGLAKDGKFSATANDGDYGMIKAAEEAIGGAATDGTKIGESANNGAAADADSVKNIAKGMKGIVDAAGTAAGKKDGALKDIQADAADAAAGKLFGTGDGGGAAGADDIKKAAEAVSSVSGEQILKAIVDAAGGGEQDGAAPGAARNPIAAAIGAAGAGANFDADMQKKDKVAAALVLRGLAKGGKFSATANDANVKSAVENAVGKKEDVLKDVKAAGAADQETGKLFGAGVAGGDAGAADIKKAAEAVSSVSGEQILKAIVDAAAGEEGEQVGAAPGAARNPIAAAIGAAGGGANFDADMQKKDKVAAALVLRGLAKDGKFSATANDANVKSAVENAVGKKDGALKDVQAAGGEADAAAGKLFGTARGGAAGEKGGEQDGKAPNAAKNPIAAAIGNGAGDNFGVADMRKKDKVAAALVLRGLAKNGKFSAADGGDYGMIKAADEAIVGATGDGKIGESAANGAAADANSVKNIAKGMKGIVDAAGTAAGKKDGVLKDVQADAADAAAGKLFGTAAGGDAVAADIKKAAEAVSSVSGEQILKAIVDAAGGGEQDGKAPGDAKNPIAAAIGAGAGAGANFHNDMKKKDKVAAALVLRGLAKGGKFSAADANDANVKSAVENAVGKKEDVLKDVQAAAGDAAEAGKLFGTTRGGAAGEKGGEQDGAAPGAARNPIAAAIGNGNGANFVDNDMRKKDKVAAALVLRGLAKDGKFSAADGGDYGMIKAAEEAIGGATGGDGKIGESANNGVAADADSVKKIAKGMKGIVDAAGTAAGKKEDVLKDVQDAGDADAAAGKLFGTAGAGGNDAVAEDIKKAAEAVSSVSGEQILKAIVDAAGGGAKLRDDKGC
ncbi:variable large family protein [Borreliella burgdorferi]|uniref:variable large family protein n=1 Tax=Borreliella burgdorferi TaxID=139 RepID=UPI001304C8AB|nr:variable large family protein [Borreliella burgdorferi]